MRLYRFSGVGPLLGLGAAPADVAGGLRASVLPAGLAVPVFEAAVVAADAGVGPPAGGCNAAATGTSPNANDPTNAYVDREETWARPVVPWNECLSGSRV